MGIRNIVGDSERSVPKITFLTRRGPLGPVREKTTTAGKLIPKNIKYFTK
jgi:hypothetical protein